MALRGFADRPFEDKDLIGHVQWVAMIEVDLQLRRTVLVNEGIDAESLLVSEVIHVLYKILKLSHGIDTKGHARHFSAP